MAGTIPTTQLPQLERIQELQDAFNLLVGLGSLVQPTPANLHHQLFNTAKFFRDPAMGPHKRAKLKTKLIPQAQTRYENALSDLEFGIVSVLITFGTLEIRTNMVQSNKPNSS